MRFCIYRDINRGHECQNEYGGVVRPEWEHAIKVAGKSLQEAWAIQPVCWFHHRGGGMDKKYHHYRALMLATDEELKKYPRSGFIQEREYLKTLYGQNTLS